MVYRNYRVKQLFAVILLLSAAFNAVAQDEQKPKLSYSQALIQNRVNRLQKSDAFYAVSLGLNVNGLVNGGDNGLFEIALSPCVATVTQYWQRKYINPEERSSKWMYAVPVLQVPAGILARLAYGVVFKNYKFNWVEFIVGSAVLSISGLVAAGIAARLEYYNDCHAQEASVKAEEVV